MQLNKKISRKAFLAYVSAFVGAIVLSKISSNAGAAKALNAGRAKKTGSTYGNTAYGN